MPKILPIKNLKNTSNISEMCNNMDEPIFITKNGYGDMVLMSIELFEATQKKWNMYSEIELSEKQIKDGKTKDARKALSAVREKYGL
ncbi:MAG: type II toxin-antitoxin system Phd/YefM family antitoxin [Lachnospiraceae bacterium]|nr:type II toxin-antitoxin system Phd/YefM family antitoxin [Lachnospiraceae bacterium]